MGYSKCDGCGKEVPDERAGKYCPDVRSGCPGLMIPMAAPSTPDLRGMPRVYVPGRGGPLGARGNS